MINKNDIAYNIKSWRQKAGMPVKDVVIEFEHRGINISEKTIYGWESGHSQPDADKFVVLCDIYGIHNLLDEFFNKTDNKNISFEEMELIKKYRELPETVQSTVTQMVDNYYSMQQQAAAAQARILDKEPENNIRHIQIAAYGGQGVESHPYGKSKEEEIDQIFEDIDREKRVKDWQNRKK